MPHLMVHFIHGRWKWQSHEIDIHGAVQIPHWHTIIITSHRLFQTSPWFDLKSGIKSQSNTSDWVINHSKITAKVRQNYDNCAILRCNFKSAGWPFKSLCFTGNSNSDGQQMVLVSVQERSAYTYVIVEDWRGKCCYFQCFSVSST